MAPYPLVAEEGVGSERHFDSGWAPFGGVGGPDACAVRQRLLVPAGNFLSNRVLHACKKREMRLMYSPANGRAVQGGGPGEVLCVYLGGGGRA
jgi:hypothetical protein